MADTYELYYWPGIQGRGEPIRLLLEDAGVPYVDVARGEDGMAALQAILKTGTPKPFAPPILKCGDLVLSHTAVIMAWLGARLGYAPADEAGRLAAHEVGLTLVDLWAEIHDTHHPIAVSLYYEDQKAEALRRAKHLRDERLPKYLRHFEALEATRPSSYLDVWLFQTLDGLRYAFPRWSKAFATNIPKLTALHYRVGAREGVAQYLASPRRLPFNEHGLFRHYDELDAPA